MTQIGWSCILHRRSVPRIYRPKTRTVIIDNRLLEENQEHRYRFTLGHEGGHDILHSYYYAYDPNQLSIVSAQPEPMVQCRADCQSIRKPFDRWDDHDRMEWQANRLSAAILMPESAVRLIASDYDPAVLQRNPVALDHLVIVIANAFNVSMEAATYRLKDLRVLKKDAPCGYYSTAAMIFLN